MKNSAIIKLPNTTLTFPYEGTYHKLYLMISKHSNRECRVQSQLVIPLLYFCVRIKRALDYSCLRWQPPNKISLLTGNLFLRGAPLHCIKWAMIGVKMRNTSVFWHLKRPCVIFSISNEQNT